MQSKVTCAASCIAALFWALLTSTAVAQTPLPELRALVPSVASYPGISPDSRYLLYSSGVGFDLDLYRLDLETREVLQLTENEFEDSAAAWSPDGKWIVFQREDETGNRDIWKIDSDGQMQTNVTNTPGLREQHPRFARGGSAVVFDSNRDATIGGGEVDAVENYEIYMLSLATDSLQRLTFWDRWDMYPSLSPDGNHLVWRRALAGVEGSERNFEIFVKDLVTGRETNVTKDAALDTNPHWSPAGDWIVFASNRGGSNDLYVMRPDGSDVRSITKGGSRSIGYGRPSFSGDGTRVVANRFVRGVTDMVVVDFPGIAGSGSD